MRKKSSETQLHKRKALEVGVLKNHFWEKATTLWVEAISMNKREQPGWRGVVLTLFVQLRNQGTPSPKKREEEVSV